MRNRKQTKMSLLAVIVLAAVIFFAGLPTAATVKPVVQDPRIYSTSVAPENIGLGSPFDLDLYFSHYYVNNEIDNNELDQSQYAIITVTSESNTISVGKNEYRINTLNEDPKDGEESEENTYYYHLYIPQKELKRTGSGYGILKFTIVYYNSGDDKIEINGKNNRFTVEKLVFGKLDTSSEPTSTDGRLTVQSYKMDHSPVKEGENFNLTFTVKNNGTIPCSNVTSVLDLSGAAGVSLKGVTDTKPVGALAAGATATVTYPMTCLDKMKTDNYPVSIKLSAKEMSEYTSKIYIPVTGTRTDKDETGIGDSKPQIIIESYDFGGKSVTGGMVFTLTMNIRNTGKAAMENVKMTVSSGDSGKTNPDTVAPGGVFTPAKSSNTFFISSLGAGKTVQEKIDLLPQSDASPNSYGVNLAFKYESVLDGKRQSLEAEETIAIPLTQPDRFEVGDVQLEDPVYMGEGGRIDIEYVNKGKSKIYNLAVKLEGNFTSTDGNTYIGNVDSGTSDSYEATIEPSEEGNLTGKAIFTYEDASGKTKTVEKEFSGNVMAMEGPGDEKEGLIGPDGKEIPANAKPGAQPNRLPLILGIIGGVIVVIVVLVIVLKKHKAKKLRQLEELEDNDEPFGGNGK